MGTTYFHTTHNLAQTNICEPLIVMADDKDDAVDTAGVSDTQLSAEVSARDSEVTKLLLKKDKAGALIAALYNPPVAAKNAEIKVIIQINFI